MTANFTATIIGEKSNDKKGLGWGYIYINTDDIISQVFINDIKIEYYQDINYTTLVDNSYLAPYDLEANIIKFDDGDYTTAEINLSNLISNNILYAKLIATVSVYYDTDEVSNVLLSTSSIIVPYENAIDEGLISDQIHQTSSVINIVIISIISILLIVIITISIRKYNYNISKCLSYELPLAFEEFKDKIYHLTHRKTKHSATSSSSYQTEMDVKHKKRPDIIRLHSLDDNDWDTLKSLDENKNDIVDHQDIKVQSDSVFDIHTDQELSQYLGTNQNIDNTSYNVQSVYKQAKKRNSKLGIHFGSIISKPKLPANWEECISPEGYTYYYNHDTGVSQWDHPNQ